MEDELRQARRRPGGGADDGLEGHPPEPRRAPRPEASDRLVHLPRSDRRGEDRAGTRARRVPLRGRQRPHQARHVGVHGEVRGLAARRGASGLRRLRRGRPAHRAGEETSLLRRPLRRDREGAPGRLQHPPSGARGRPAHRQLRPRRELPEHGHHHDVQRRREGHRQGTGHRLPAGRGLRRTKSTRR